MVEVINTTGLSCCEYQQRSFNNNLLEMTKIQNSLICWGEKDSWNFFYTDIYSKASLFKKLKFKWLCFGISSV